MPEDDGKSGGAGCDRERDREGMARRRDVDPTGESCCCCCCCCFLAETVVGDEASIREDLCVRSCCFMLSFRVKALLHVGQWMFFSPVCFFPWRAAWPEVVNVS